MKRLLAALALLNGGCAATLVSTPEDGLHVIGFNTGTMATGMYDEKFEAKAKEVCGHDFEVIEKSNHPKILHNAGSLVDKYQYYWVVRCKGYAEGDY